MASHVDHCIAREWILDLYHSPGVSPQQACERNGPVQGLFDSTPDLALFQT
jgi:hypothetical protein